MAGFKDFREIAAWQHSREVRSLAYQLLKHPAAASDFKFRDQFHRRRRQRLLAPRRLPSARTRLQEGARSNQRIDSLPGINARSPDEQTHLAPGTRAPYAPGTVRTVRTFIPPTQSFASV